MKKSLCRYMLPVVTGIVVMTFAATSASASPFTVAATKGSLSASVAFDVVGGNLQITLTNTSTADVLVPTDVLTAVFFTLVGDPKLTPVSAVLGDGSVVLFGKTDPGRVVGGEWAYAYFPLSGAPRGANQGISSSGLDGLFGAANFPGNNLQDPASLDGLQYGITSAGDDQTTGNKKVTETQALIQNEVVFTLGFPSEFALSDISISNVSFQYGTALTEPNISVPDASIVLLLGSSLLGLGLLGRRKSRK